MSGPRSDAAGSLLIEQPSYSRVVSSWTGLQAAACLCACGCRLCLCPFVSAGYIARLLLMCLVLETRCRTVRCLLQGGEDEDVGASPQDLWAPSVLTRITDIACSL